MSFTHIQQNIFKSFTFERKVHMFNNYIGRTATLVLNYKKVGCSTSMLSLEFKVFCFLS